MRLATKVRKPIEKGRVVRRRLQVPSSIEVPSYVYDGRAPSILDAPRALYKLNSQEIRALRSTCAIAAEGREYAASLVKPDITTDEIDAKLADFFITKKKVYPSPYNYLGFPKCLCTSINEVMVHGIPDDRVLQDGDLVSLDVSCYKNGVHGDNCTTVGCGTLDETAARLLRDGRSCFEQTLKVCGPGVPINAIGEFVESWCEKNGYDTNRDFIGHGIGPLFHMKPMVYHCRNDVDDIMQPGMVFTIEPIITEGSAEMAPTWDDKWTVVTKDGSLSVQFEHTVLITENGYEILTKFD
jgi:methionyl aminopeptidase